MVFHCPVNHAAAHRPGMLVHVNEMSFHEEFEYGDLILPIDLVAENER